MSNPFEPPRTDGSAAPLAPASGGRISAVEVLTDAVALFGRYGLVLSAAFLLFTVLGLGTFYLCCIGLFVGPVLYWGTVRIALDAGTGTARLGTLFSGFSQAGHAWVQIVLVGLAWFVVNLPAMGVVTAANLVMTSLDPNQGLWVAVALQQPALLFWAMAVNSRLTLMPMLAVDRDIQALDALTGSWRLTAPSWGAFAALAGVSFLATLPATVTGTIGQSALTTGLLTWLGRMAPEAGSNLAGNFPQMFPGMDDVTQTALGAALIVTTLLLSSISSAFGALVSVAAYRRVLPAA